MAKRKKSKLRTIKDPFVVAPPTGSSIRASLKLTPQDEYVLRQVCELLGRLFRSDLAYRVKLARAADKATQYHKHLNRAERKKAMTPYCSGRWAGSVTGEVDELWAFSMRNKRAHKRSNDSAIKTISQRLAKPANKGGYKTPQIAWEKRGKLIRRKNLALVLANEIDNADLSIGVGGRRMAKLRHNLEAAGITEEQWRNSWEPSRWFCKAHGDSGYEHGNGLISVDPDTGKWWISLPRPLKHLANAPFGRYVFTNPVVFRQAQAGLWAAQALTGPVTYNIWYEPDKRKRWYIDASWSIPARSMPTVEDLKPYRTLAVDLNAGHIAGWVVAPDGNVVGSPITLEIPQKGSSKRRDGQLRAAISSLLEIACEYDCASITIEDLNFQKARDVGKEAPKGGSGRRGKNFRHKALSIPTSKFRDRLVAMADRKRIAIIAVDPAYTSKWAADYWEKYFKQSRQQPGSGHHAASCVIGRRGKGQTAKRHTGKKPGGARRDGVRVSEVTKGSSQGISSESKPGTNHQQPLCFKDASDASGGTQRSLKPPGVAARTKGEKLGSQGANLETQVDTPSREDETVVGGGSLTVELPTAARRSELIATIFFNG